MNIYELLGSVHIMAHIQGIKTRIILDDNAQYRTLGQDSNKRYTIILYVGSNEQSAVKEFLINEEYTQ